MIITGINLEKINFNLFYRQEGKKSSLEGLQKFSSFYVFMLKLHVHKAVSTLLGLSFSNDVYIQFLSILNKLKRNFTVLYKNSFYETYCLYQQMDCIFSPFIFKKEERGVRHRQVRRSWPLSHRPHPPQEAEQSVALRSEFLPPASLSLFTAFFPLGKLLKFPGPQLSGVSWGTACT